MLLDVVAREWGTWALLDAVAGGGIFMGWALLVSVAEGILVFWTLLDDIACLWGASVLFGAAGVGRGRSWMLLDTVIGDFWRALEEWNTDFEDIRGTPTLLSAVADGSWGTWTPPNSVEGTWEFRWMLESEAGDNGKFWQGDVGECGDVFKSTCASRGLWEDWHLLGAMAGCPSKVWISLTARTLLVVENSTSCCFSWRPFVFMILWFLMFVFFCF